MKIADVLQDCAGIAGVFQTPRAVEICSLLLQGLQHRGMDGAGISVCMPDGLRNFVGQGLVSSLLEQEDLSSITGTSAVGQVRMAAADDRGLGNAQPVMVRNWQGHFAIAFHGHVENSRQLREAMQLEGLIFQGTGPAELLAHLVQSANGHLHEKIRSACEKMQGSWTFLLLTKSTLYVCRSADGARPLYWGTMDDGLAFASEDSVLDLAGAGNIQPFPAGCLLRIGKQAVKWWTVGEESCRPCSMEAVYFSRLDSWHVHGCRSRFGKALAKGEDCTADLVVGVPDTAVPAAMAFARELGLPYEMGLIKNRYIGSKFIQPTEKQRQQGMRVRLNALSSIVAGKDVFLVDDSVVKGATARRLSQLLKEAGACKVHLRIAAPVICRECHKGVESTRTSELAGAVYTIPEMAGLFDVDSLRFLDLQSFADCFDDICCLDCFGGKEKNG